MNRSNARTTDNRRQPDRSRQRLNRSAGFTLLELLVVTLIIGVLSAIAIPTYLTQRNRACYAKAASQMSGIARELRIYRLDKGFYPTDVSRDTVPDGIEFFPLTTDGTTACDSPYDYESYTVAEGCYIQVSYLGLNTEREMGVGGELFPDPGLHEGDGDDLALSLGTDPNPCFSE